MKPAGDFGTYWECDWNFPDGDKNECGLRRLVDERDALRKRIALQHKEAETDGD